jgi:ergothioneine biosynthesis protein EgtB
MSSSLPVHDPIRIRHADKDLLSLALMDARNRTLHALSVFEAAGEIEPQRDIGPPQWLAGEAGWFQEHWIARNVQRQRGERCNPAVPRLPSIDPGADDSYAPWSAGEPSVQWRRIEWLPGFDATRRYLAQTLETTLELLEGQDDESDDALYFFRLALWHEDRLPELFAALAQGAGLDPALQKSLWPEELPARSPRDPLLFPAQRFSLGSARDEGGFVPDNERWAHEHSLPEFEIDAQAVSWAQFAEFAADGGYDDEQWWSSDGWAWAVEQTRRVPRYVEQLRNGVLLQRRGLLQRVAAVQPAMHVTLHEAEAWCRWAGRRLPTEAEWELAARQGSGRGFVWGDAGEWTLDRARAYPGFTPGPSGLEAPPPADNGAWRVVRGGSWLTSPRRKHSHARRFVSPDHDTLFLGFRSCAL